MNKLLPLLIALLLGALPLQAQDLLVRGGKIFTGTADRTVTNPGVYVRNGRIMAVGEVPDELPSSVQTLQLSDEEVLLPGLVDLHAHYRVVMEGMVGDDTAATPKIFLANGVTATFPAGEVEPEKMRELGRLIDAGKRDGPRLLNSGPYYGSAAPDWSREMDEAAIRERVDTWAARGAAGFKAKGITAPHLEALIERAHRHGLTVTAHLGSGSGSSVNPAEAVRMGIDRVEHFLGGPCLPASASAYASLRSLDGSEPCVDEVIDLYTRHGVWFDATLSTYGIIGRVDHPAYRHWTDELRFMTPYMREAFESDPDHSLEELFRDVYHAKKAILKRYYEAGGRITLGTDRPVMKSTLPFLGGFAAHREMQAMTLAGIPNHEVLRIATHNGARAIGMGDRLGTIEEGKLADFFVAGGDPLEDITHTRDVRAVVKGGIVYHPDALLQAAEGRLGPASASDWR